MRLPSCSLRLPIRGLLQLLERFYEPTGGVILVDGRPLASLDPSWVRRHVGYIHQEPVLFGTTILDNIRYGSPGATDAQVHPGHPRRPVELLRLTMHVYVCTQMR
jgi:ABC-type transport system involved in cytochrome bd biosynthesis fused ATPase/permease subunit